MLKKTHHSKGERGSTRGRVLLALAILIPLLLAAANPPWWSERGVIDPAKAPSDFAPINQGQLKNLASAAVAEMNEKIAGGAGETLNALVASWQNNTSSSNDYAPVNLGQLKNLAEPFYDRLSLAYPWANVPIPANDFALANIGQAKNLFSFLLIDPNLDSDNDGMSDVYELNNGLNRFNPVDAADAPIGYLPDHTLAQINDKIFNVEKARADIPRATNVSYPQQYLALTGHALEDPINHNPALSVPENDWDIDGISNLDELVVFQTDPRNSGSRPSDFELSNAYLHGRLSLTTTAYLAANYHFWAGGTYTINGRSQTLSGQFYSPSVGDRDGDGIPDNLDPYADDPNNGAADTTSAAIVFRKLGSSVSGGGKIYAPLDDYELVEVAEKEKTETVVGATSRQAYDDKLSTHAYNETKKTGWKIGSMTARKPVKDDEDIGHATPSRVRHDDFFAFHEYGYNGSLNGGPALPYSGITQLNVEDRSGWVDRSWMTDFPVQSDITPQTTISWMDRDEFGWFETSREVYDEHLAEPYNPETKTGWRLEPVDGGNGIVTENLWTGQNNVWTGEILTVNINTLPSGNYSYRNYIFPADPKYFYNDYDYPHEIYTRLYYNYNNQYYLDANLAGGAANIYYSPLQNASHVASTSTDPCYFWHLVHYSNQTINWDGSIRYHVGPGTYEATILYDWHVEHYHPGPDTTPGKPPISGSIRTYEKVTGRNSDGTPTYSLFYDWSLDYYVKKLEYDNTNSEDQNDSLTDYEVKNPKLASSPDSPGGIVTLQIVQEMIAQLAVQESAGATDPQPYYTGPVGDIKTKLTLPPLDRLAFSQQPSKALTDGTSDTQPTIICETSADAHPTQGIAYHQANYELHWFESKKLIDHEISQTWLIICEEGSAKRYGTVTLVKEKGQILSNKTIISSSNLWVDASAGQGTFTVDPPLVANASQTYRVTLTPIEVVQPTVDTQGNGGALTKVDDVRFSRWWKAYPNTAPFNLNNDFIKNDPDRFVIKIPAAIAADKTTVKAKLSTKAPQGIKNGSEYEQAATEITLTKIGDWFESNPMILVTNKDDADETKTSLKKAQNDTEDATIIAWMGGTIELDLPMLLTKKLEFKIAKAKAKLTIQTAIVDSQGIYSATFVKLQQPEFQREAKEIFAQELIDIKFDGAPVDIPFTPTSKLWKATLADQEIPQTHPEDYDSNANNLYLLKTYTFGGYELAPEAKNVLDEVATIAKWKKNAVKLIYAPFISVARNDRTGLPLSPTWTLKTIPVAGLTMITEPTFAKRFQPSFTPHEGTIFISSHASNMGNPRVLAHELCHLATKGNTHVAEVPIGSSGSGIDYPFHRLLISYADYLPLLMKRFSPDEDKILFSQPASYLTLIKP